MYLFSISFYFKKNNRLDKSVIIEVIAKKPQRVIYASHVSCVKEKKYPEKEHDNSHVHREIATKSQLQYINHD
jgi:hypothetical protein